MCCDRETSEIAEQMAILSESCETVLYNTRILLRALDMILKPSINSFQPAIQPVPAACSDLAIELYEIRNLVSSSNELILLMINGVDL